MVQLKAPSKSTWAARTCLGMGGGRCPACFGGGGVCVCPMTCWCPPPHRGPPKSIGEGCPDPLRQQLPPGGALLLPRGTPGPPLVGAGGVEETGGPGGNLGVGAAPLIASPFLVSPPPPRLKGDGGTRCALPPPKHMVGFGGGGYCDPPTPRTRPPPPSTPGFFFVPGGTPLPGGVGGGRSVPPILGGTPFKLCNAPPIPCV